MTSNSYVVGSCVAVDTILTIGREFATWCENDKDIATDYNKIDFNSELILKNALESGNLTVVARKILDSITLKCHIVHQMMASSESNMCSISRRKREPVAYIMKKDASQMKLFSWNDTFMEAYSVMPDLVRLVIAYMIRQFGSSNQDTAVINQVIPKIGLIYSIIANQSNIKLSLVQRVMAVILHDNNCQRKI